MCNMTETTDVKNAGVISAGKVKKIAKQNGIERIGKETTIYLANHVTEYLAEIIEKAKVVCQNAGHKTISRQDVETVLKIKE